MSYYSNKPKYDPDEPPTGARKSDNDLYIVRLFDMFDGWCCDSKPMPWSEAVTYWMEQTDNGTRRTKYADGDYWDIFPDGTRMLYRPETLGR